MTRARYPKPKQALPLATPSHADWQIEKLVPGGRGFARLPNGQGAFASGALPGERVHVSAARDHGGYLVAEQWSLVQASADRIAPACPAQQACGGCDLMALSYPAQTRAKREILIEALQRTGHFEVLPDVRFFAAPAPLQYRSRIRLHIAEDGRLGYFAADSRRLVEIAGCVVAHPELEAELAPLRGFASEHADAWRQFAELELRVAPLGPRLSLRLVPREASGRTQGTAPLVRALAARYQVTVGENSLSPVEEQRFPVLEDTFLRAPAQAFTQVNWAVNQQIVQAVLAGVVLRGVTTFCDLYCGAGNFSLPLFARGLNGVGVEATPSAVAAAERAAVEQGFGHARFIAGDVRQALQQLPRGEYFDLMLLDPPRSGARDVLEQIVARAPRYIAYCACDPVTLARDLRALCDSGYALQEVSGFDMFPQTHHFESLAWLERRAPATP